MPIVADPAMGPATGPATGPAAISRRALLIKGGWMAAGVTVLASCGPVRSILPALPSTAVPELKDGSFWVQALPDGRIRFLCPRMEMGQGASLGLSQVVAEELNVGPSEIECVIPDSSQTPPFKMTVGSESISEFFEPVSHGAARLRETLRVMAAEKTDLSPAQIKDGRGGFILPDGTELGYGALVGPKPVVLPATSQSTAESPPPRYALERKGNYRAIGLSWRHHELEAIVTGQTVYSRDVTLPGLLFGNVLRPPAFGARLRGSDGRAARSIPGVVAVVVDKSRNFLGVITDDPFVLPAATQALKAQWDIPEDLSQEDIDGSLDVERLRDRDDFEHTLTSAGDIGAGQRAAQHRVAARYDTSFAAHAAMEPRAGVVSVKNDKVEVWCGSQDPFFVQRRVAKAIGRKVDDVIVYSHRMGGGFGGRVPCQASEEAAILSAAVEQPVRVQWDRESEFQHNYFQPGFSHFIDAGVTDGGTISHWDHDYVSSPIIFGLVPKNISWALDMVMADEGTARGSLPLYRLANRRIRYSDVRTAVPVGAWRGLGSAPNIFAIESMIDELAATAGIDPLEFRLRNLPPANQRMASVLRRVADISGWGKPVPPDTGRGMACAAYQDKTAVAVVVEIRVDHAARQLRVSKAWCAQDCGLIVNPRQVEDQIMGNVVWGCSMALKERITFKAGRVEQSNFDSYEFLRHDETPEMTVALAGPPDAPPAGVGESAFAPVAAAVANAVFAATARRIRRLPMNYDSVFSNAKS